MRTLLGSSLGLALLAAAVPAQNAPRDAWTQFLQANGPNWTAEWNPATGTPTAIYGEGLTVKNGRITSLDEARRLAAATLDRHAELLGRGPSTFVEDIGVKARQLYILVYKQYYQGFEVISGRADVRVHETGGISMFGSEAFPIAKGFVTEPQVSITAARKTAFAAKDLPLPAGPLGNNDRLVIWGDSNAPVRSTPRLAWEIDVDRRDLEIVGKSYVDALSGAVLHWRNDWHECGLGCNHSGPVLGPMATNVVGRVMAWTNTGLRPIDPLKNIPVKGVRVSVVGGNSGLTDNNGLFNIPHSGTTAVQVVVEFKGRHVGDTIPRQGTKLRKQVTATPGTPVNIQIYSSSVGQHDFAQSTGYWATDDINEYLRAINKGLPSRIESIVCYTSLTRTCNAHYTRNTINFYQAGGGCNMTAYSTVIYHEWGHGIDDAYGGISQTDGLSEGWSDIVAIYRTGQPIVGDYFRTNGGYIRTGLNTRTYPAGGSVHQQGQTWMGFAWDLRMNLIATHGSTKGIATAENIVLPTLAANARNQPTAVREVFLLDDDDNNLNNGTPNYKDLEKACLKRRLPYPVKKSQNPGSWTSYGAGCKGTGSLPANCMSANTSGSLRGSQGYANVTYLLELSAPRPLQVNGFEILQNSRRSSSVTVSTYLYDADGSGRPRNQLATGTMTIGSQTGFYKTTLNRVVTIGSGQRFFIGFRNASPTITVGTMSSGTVVPYWRNNGTGGSWIRFSTRPWGYKVICASSGGGAIPVLSNDGVPELGDDFDLNLSFAAKNTPAILFFGASNKTWGGIGLPLDLKGLGAPGCSLLASGEIQVALPVSGLGTASVNIKLPNDAKLENQLFYNQVLVIDAKANQLGLAFSNGGAARIGKP